jgi:hypothetical protein
MPAPERFVLSTRGDPKARFEISYRSDPLARSR